MKLKVLEYYGHKAGFDSWVLDFIYRNESVRAIILMEDGTLSESRMEDLKVEIKGEF